MKHLLIFIAALFITPVFAAPTDSNISTPKPASKCFPARQGHQMLMQMGFLPIFQTVIQLPNKEDEAILQEVWMHYKLKGTESHSAMITTITKISAQGAKATCLASPIAEGEMDEEAIAKLIGVDKRA